MASAPVRTVEPRSILVCRPNVRLGNTLLLTPLVAEIEARFPQARTDILTACNDAPGIFAGFPGVGRVLRFPRHGAGQPWRWLAVLLRAEATRYDLILDPDPQSWTSRFLTRILRGGCKAGFLSDWKRGRLEVSVPMAEAPAHMGAWPVFLLRRATAASAEDDAPVPPLTLRLAPAEREQGRALRDRVMGGEARGPVIALATEATGAKRYPVDWWRRLIEALRSVAPQVRLLEIRPPSGRANLPELPGYASADVRAIAALIDATACFVCADSGLMHLGAATGTATVGLFKVTDPRRYAPYGGASCGIEAGDDPAPVAARIANVIGRSRAA